MKLARTMGCSNHPHHQAARRPSSTPPLCHPHLHPQPLTSQTLAASSDVRPLLERRFSMLRWFKQHGYPSSIWSASKAAGQLPAAQTGPLPAPSSAVRCKLQLESGEAAAAAAAPCALSQQRGAASAAAGPQPVVRQQKEVLLLCGFDKTLTDFDAGALVFALCGLCCRLS